VTVQQAQAAMNVTARRLAADYPDTDSKRGITVLATDDVHIHPREKFLKPIATVVFSVVGLVLAIACSNLATLLLVRGSARATEISVRLALGATRRQLMRHLLMESLVLSLAGTAVGVAIAHWGLRYLATIDLPIILSMQLDYRVLGFAIAVATLCALGFGLTPALQATRVDVAGALREQKGSSGSSLSLTRGWFTLKNALVTGQVAASFLLLVGAVLAIKRSHGHPKPGCWLSSGRSGHS
jgi:predicted lysophospholipase L1 biosynthesis ABC-type transport system permease subunit